MHKLRASDTDRLNFCATFLAESLTDDNKWVRNQAYHQFGPILHAMYVKSEQWDAETKSLKTKIKEVSDQFYIPERLNKIKADKSQEKL